MSGQSIRTAAVEPPSRYAAADASEPIGPGLAGVTHIAHAGSLDLLSIASLYRTSPELALRLAQANADAFWRDASRQKDERAAP